MTRIHTSLERWRYNIGLITSTTLIAQLLTAAHGQPIEPVAGMGEVKREIRQQQRKLNEERAKVSELEKEVERLEESTEKRLYRQDITRSISDDSSGHNSNRSDPGTGNIPKSINVEATFYSAFCSTGCIGITATGLDVSSTIYTPDGKRIIAVDPTQIPLGSLVKVTLENGDSFEARAEDIGGSIKGSRIDVLVGDKSTALRLGRQSAKVEIINEGGR